MEGEREGGREEKKDVRVHWKSNDKMKRTVILSKGGTMKTE